MSEWNEYLIEELIQSMQLGTSEIGNENNFGVPLLKMGNLLIGGFNFEKLEKLKENDAKKLAPFILKKGDFLFNTRNTLELVGKSAVWNNQLAIATFNSNIMRIKFKEEVDDFYLGFYFSGESGWSEFKRVATGTTSVAAIYSRDLLKCKVLLPEYKSQLKIAHILSTADAVIEKTQAAIAKYNAIKQGMLHDLFTRGIDPATGKLRPTYEDAPELYEESKLGWIPKKWEAKPLEELVDIDSMQLSSSTESDFTFFYIDISSVTTGQIIYPNHPIRFQGAPSRARRIVKYNDVLMSTVRPNLKAFTHFKRKSKYQYIASTGLAVLSPKTKTDIDFIYQVLFTEYFERQIEKYVVGSNYPAINSTDLKVLLVKTPNPIEQTEIAKRILIIDNRIQTEQTYLHKLQHIKAGLMADLLSGKKKVNVDEEPVN